MDKDDHSGRSMSVGRDCANCGAHLAHDQRYCIRCGTRRGPLPASVESTLLEMRTAPVVVVPEPEPDPRPPFPRQLPTPRVASLAVMAMLSFGVVAGSLSAPGGVEALAHTFVVSVSPPAATTPAVADPG